MTPLVGGTRKTNASETVPAPSVVVVCFVVQPLAPSAVSCLLAANVVAVVTPALNRPISIFTGASVAVVPWNITHTDLIRARTEADVPSSNMVFAVAAVSDMPSTEWKYCAIA